ncbi:MAG: hypothetical protein J6Y82_11935 [Bacteroidales bacterium]|nr:hypothetical protein [Bacteroidales bacterium]
MRLKLIVSDAFLSAEVDASAKKRRAGIAESKKGITFAMTECRCIHSHLSKTTNNQTDE